MQKKIHTYISLDIDTFMAFKSKYPDTNLSSIVNNALKKLIDKQKTIENNVKSDNSVAPIIESKKDIDTK